ncbi:PAAR domain-containing protein [Vibrio sp. TRT 2004]|uniref:PAAR domain-containing protein n=1 Tax=Vibrio sp. TRT 2004 TaxID=3418506 RepID=UPI003CF290EE
MAKKLSLAVLGDPTTTGGEIVEGASTVFCDKKPVALVGGKATCKKCKKGWGKICRTTLHEIKAEEQYVALGDFIVECDCPLGSNRILTPEGRFSFIGLDNGMVQVSLIQGQSLTFGDGTALSPDHIISSMTNASSSAPHHETTPEYSSNSSTDESKKSLESEVYKATTSLLAFLPTLELENSVYSQAVKEFSEAFDVILKGYNQEKITYDVGYDLIHQIKNGFIEGGGALRKLEENRLSRRTEKAAELYQDSSYQRNLVVNNESFNVRFKASCATPECLMRNANIDMEDEAFQDYIEAATQDKRSDVMQVIGVALIANPYLAPLQRVIQADVVYSAASLDFDPLWAYAVGIGAAYRLRLLNLPKRVQDTSESVVSYFSGNILSDDK